MGLPAGTHRATPRAPRPPRRTPSPSVPRPTAALSEESPS
jgi:hypothetical protein